MVLHSQEASSQRYFLVCWVVGKIDDDKDDWQFNKFLPNNPYPVAHVPKYYVCFQSTYVWNNRKKEEGEYVL